MKCSECSRSVKPVVAIDIDGTLGDYHTHFLNFACMYMAMEPDHIPIYDGGMGFKEWFLKVFATDEATWNAIKLAYRQGGQKRSMPVYLGAEDLVDVCRHDGAEVWLTTTRPYLRLDAVDPDTRWWLGVNGIGYDGLLYDEHKYRVLGEQVEPERVIAVLDDLPEQYDCAAQEFGDGVPILRKTKYNRSVHRTWTADTLDAARDGIVQRIGAWYARNGH